jgi:pyridoxal/pyridoxine/pyridoxamine kinase
MLTEWAHKIGIYTENRKYENYVEHSRKNVWENDLIWNNEKLSEYKSIYESLSDNDKNTIRDQFTSVYAQARLDGKDHETAVSEAAEAVAKTLKEKKKANESSNNEAPNTTPNP